MAKTIERNRQKTADRYEPWDRLSDEGKLFYYWKNPEWSLGTAENRALLSDKQLF